MHTYEKHGYTEEELNDWMKNPKDEKLTCPEAPEDLPDCGNSSEDDENKDENDGNNEE